MMVGAGATPIMRFPIEANRPLNSSFTRPCNNDSFFASLDFLVVCISKSSNHIILAVDLEFDCGEKS